MDTKFKIMDNDKVLPLASTEEGTLRVYSQGMEVNENFMIGLVKRSESSNDLPNIETVHDLVAIFDTFKDAGKYARANNICYPAWVARSLYEVITVEMGLKANEKLEVGKTYTPLASEIAQGYKNDHYQFVYIRTAPHD